MVGGVEQPALLELALDLDEAVAELAQQPDARRFVVDKGAAAAVRTEQPAQHDGLALAIEPGVGVRLVDSPAAMGQPDLVVLFFCDLNDLSNNNYRLELIDGDPVGLRQPGDIGQPPCGTG